MEGRLGPVCLTTAAQREGEAREAETNAPPRAADGRNKEHNWGIGFFWGELEGFGVGCLGGLVCRW